MTEPNRASPRHLFRKNTPAETRANWQFVKAKGASHLRMIARLVIVIMLFPAAYAFYALGYFNGTQAVRSEIISQESK